MNVLIWLSQFLSWSPTWTLTYKTVSQLVYNWVQKIVNLWIHFFLYHLFTLKLWMHFLLLLLIFSPTSFTSMFSNLQSSSSVLYCVSTTCWSVESCDHWRDVNRVTSVHETNQTSNSQNTFKLSKHFGESWWNEGNCRVVAFLFLFAVWCTIHLRFCTLTYIIWKFIEVYIECYTWCFSFGCGNKTPWTRFQLVHQLTPLRFI